MAERIITQKIKKVEQEIRAEKPWLKHQDALGAGVFVGSLVGIASSWAVYHAHSSSIAVCGGCLLSVAFFTSLLHELEHDLIHSKCDVIFLQ